MKIGDPVIFVDSSGVPHEALCTNVFGEPRTVQVDGKDVLWHPCINVVWVSTDESKSDPYGRQLERATSVGHDNFQTAHGYFYKIK